MILGDALRRLAAGGRSSGVLFAFLRDPFTLEQLGDVLHAVYGVPLSPGGLPEAVPQNEDRQPASSAAGTTASPAGTKGNGGERAKDRSLRKGREPRRTARREQGRTAPHRRAHVHLRRRRAGSAARARRRLRLHPDLHEEQHAVGRAAAGRGGDRRVQAQLRRDRHRPGRRAQQLPHQPRRAGRGAGEKIVRLVPPGTRALPRARPAGDHRASRLAHRRGRGRRPAPHPQRRGRTPRTHVRLAGPHPASRPPPGRDRTSAIASSSSRR